MAVRELVRPKTTSSIHPSQPERGKSLVAVAVQEVLVGRLLALPVFRLFRFFSARDFLRRLLDRGPARSGP